MVDTAALPHANLDPEEMNAEQWREAFVAAMLSLRPEHERNDDLRCYATQAADAYFNDRADHDGPKEAAATDISYWWD